MSKKKRNKKPFNHVLEVQKGFIDVREIYKRIDEKLLKEKKDGIISS